MIYYGISSMGFPFLLSPLMSTKIQSEVRRQETEILNGMASVRAGLADLLLRVEEGELQQDQFVREVRYILVSLTHIFFLKKYGWIFVFAFVYSEKGCRPVSRVLLNNNRLTYSICCIMFHRVEKRGCLWLLGTMCRTTRGKKVSW